MQGIEHGQVVDGMTYLYRDPLNAHVPFAAGLRVALLRLHGAPVALVAQLTVTDQAVEGFVGEHNPPAAPQLAVQLAAEEGVTSRLVAEARSLTGNRESEFG